MLNQETLTLTSNSTLAATADPTEAFKKLYYHLYTNSNSSRAERIISDLSKLLLVKIIADQQADQVSVRSFLDGSKSANDSLYPLLKEKFPELLDANDTFSLDDSALQLGYKVIQEINLFVCSLN